MTSAGKIFRFFLVLMVGIQPSVETRILKSDFKANSTIFRVLYSSKFGKYKKCVNCSELFESSTAMAWCQTILNSVISLLFAVLIKLILQTVVRIVRSLPCPCFLMTLSQVKPSLVKTNIRTPAV